MARDFNEQAPASALGCGYNVITGGYADPESVLRRLIPYADNSEATAVYSSTYVATSSTSVVDHQSQLAARLSLKGTYGFFSGSLNVQYGEQSFRSTTARYSSLLYFVATKALRLTSSGPLASGVNETIGTMTPEDVFDQYGTHFVNSIVVGGKAVYSAVTDTSRFTTSESWDDVVQAAYNGFWKVSGKAEKISKDTLAEFNSYSRIHAETHGGSGAGAYQIVQPEEFETWAKSVDANPVLVDFTPAGEPSLIPIWTLPLDNKKDLENAFPTYATNKTLGLSPDMLPLKTGDVIVLQAVDNDNYIQHQELERDFGANGRNIESAARFSVLVYEQGDAHGNGAVLGLSPIGPDLDPTMYLELVQDSGRACLQSGGDRNNPDARLTVQVLAAGDPAAAKTPTIALKAANGKYVGRFVLSAVQETLACVEDTPIEKCQFNVYLAPAAK